MENCVKKKCIMEICFIFLAVFLGYNCFIREAGIDFEISLHLSPLFVDFFVCTADLYALSRYIATKPEQQDKQLQGHPDESELKLAQLHHQLASNEPGALMHLVEEAEIEDDGDEETKECKSLFENMTFFLTREVVFFYPML